MQNKEKMERLAALSLLVLGIMLVFAVFDANRVNQRLSELQQTVDYGQQLEKLLFQTEVIRQLLKRRKLQNLLKSKCLSP